MLRTACRIAGLLGAVGSPLVAQVSRLRENLPTLEVAARRDSNDAAAQYAVALGYWSAKRFDDAERALRTAVQIEPRFAPGYLALSYLPFARRPKLWDEVSHSHLSDSTRALLDGMARLRRLAFLIDPLVDMRIIGFALPKHTNISFLELAFVSGDYHLAYAELEVAREQFTGPKADSIPELLLWLHGLCAGHLAQYDMAVIDMQALLDRFLRREQTDTSPYIPFVTNDFRYVLATLRQRDNQPEASIALYRDALTHDVGLFMAHVQMGKIYEASQRWPEAVQEFRDAITADPDDPSLVMDLGIVLREAGQLEESERQLREAQQANPRDSRVPYYLGITEQALGKDSAARAAFDRFLALAPSRYARQITDVHSRLEQLHP
ncbi:MAG TPA: tetratricopeptide repeat protein [Gemmatimonadales bacterium]|jgi:tetratricopeptide (TPR) repeat protein|nr:tetratricopeptide repeat protein [Gemmatimonadales bacterium]